MFALHVAHFLNASHNLAFVPRGLEGLAVVLASLTEEQYSFLVHKEVQELLFLVVEERTVFIL